MQNQGEQQKRDYSHISIKKRMALVKQVTKKGKPLSDVIKDLGIKITTARFILKKYSESGTYPRRKFRKTGQNKKKTVVKVEECQELECQPEVANMEEQNEQQKGEQGLSTNQDPILPSPFYVYWYYYPFSPSIPLTL